MVSMGEQKANIGLNLKFEAKQQKVLGYTERGLTGWEFSQKAIDLIREYTEKFPEISGTLDRKKGGGAIAEHLLGFERLMRFASRPHQGDRLLRALRCGREDEAAQGLDR